MLRNRLSRVLPLLEVKRDLKLICLYEFVFCFGDGLFSFLLPVYIRQLSASPFDVGMLFAVFYLSWALTLLLGGFLADRFDQKKIMILGSLLWVPVPIAFAVATNWSQLWLPMVLYGTYFGEASICVYVLRSAPREKTMQAFGLMSASVAFGYLFSPVIGGFLSSFAGMQTVFILANVFYAAAVIPLLFVSRLPKAEIKEKQVTSKHSLAKLSRSNRLILLSALFGMMVFAVFLIDPFVPQFLSDVHGQSIFHLGLFGTATSLGWILFSFALGKVGDKSKKTTAMLASATISSISFALIAATNSLPVLFSASVLRGSSRCLTGFVPGIIGSAAPEGCVGRWTSISLTVVYVAKFVGPVLGGVLYEASPYLAFLMTISLLLLFTVAAILKKL